MPVNDAERANHHRAERPTRSRRPGPARTGRKGRGPAAQAWSDFFDGKVRNGHTRKAYARAVRHFLAWCEGQGLELPRIMAGDVGRYLAQLAGGAAKKKGTLAALRRGFLPIPAKSVIPDWGFLLYAPERYSSALCYQNNDGEIAKLAP